MKMKTDNNWLDLKLNMTEYPAEGEIEHTEASLTIEEDIRDLLLGYEDMDCPSCEDSQLTFQDDGGGIEAFCEELTEPACRLIYTKFEENKVKEGSLEEWLALYKTDGLPIFSSKQEYLTVIVQVRRIVAWWQQADKPLSYTKNAHEIALEAIENIEELWRN